MNEQNQDPTTPAPDATSSAEPAEPAGAAPALEKPARRRPSCGQLLVATVALLGVLVVGSVGFALGRATAEDSDRPGWPGDSERFDRGPGGGPMMMPPGQPRDDSEMPQAPEVPQEPEDGEES